MVFQLSRKKMGIITAFSSLWVFIMVASTVNARVINKRAAFYIANDTMCIVDGELYFNGDPVPTDDHCEKCTCRPPGFSCVLRDCEVKPGCKAVRKDGECCPDYICGCSHNGNVYKDGDFIRDLQNPCYTCRCHGSSISCTFADCLFRSDCGPEYIQGECCPRYDHCPPLSTTQKSTTVITTVPITYDETTKPLFNLTSPPHERLATHTTIFPTTGMITVDGGETHTTETYVKPAVSDVSTEAAQTTRGHDFSVTSSSASSTPHITQADASTFTTADSKIVTETLPEVDKDSSQKPMSLADETTSKQSFSTDTISLATDVKMDTEVKELTSTPITVELSSEGDLLFEELHDGKVTEMPHDRQTDDTFTDASHDRHTDESVTEIPHDNRGDELVTGVSDVDEENDSETELSSSSHTVESVTEVSHDDDLGEELSHDSKTDHTPLESDETVSVTLPEEISKSTFDDMKEDESKDITQSVDDTVETTTEIHTTHEEVKISSEDEVPSSHEAFSLQPEMVAEAESTSSSMSTVTMSGGANTELSPVKAYTITETHDITTHDTYSIADVRDTSVTRVQETTTQEIHEEAAATSLPVVSSNDDDQTESEVEDKTTVSSQESGDSESSTVQPEIKSHSFVTGSTDVDDSTDELSTDESEISTQDAEENLFTVAVTPSDGSEQSETTVLDHISHSPSSEATHAQTVANELTEEQSVDASKETEDHFQTEQTESIDSNVGDIVSFSDSFSHVQRTTTTQSTEVPDSTQHTQFIPHSRETTTVQSIHTSSDTHDETTTADGRNNEDVNEFLSSVITEDATERHSDVLQRTTERLPDQENAETADTVQSSSEDHESAHLLSEGVNALSPTDEFNAESEQIHAETEGSSESPVVVTTEDAAETVITMEAESDLSLTTSEDSSTASGGEDVSITSSRATEPSEGLFVVSESITTTRAAETPVTLTSLSAISSTGVQQSTTEHVTVKPKEYEDLSEKSHITSTVPPEQETSNFNENSDTALKTTEIPSDNLHHHSEQLTEVSSIISEAVGHVTSESSTSTANDHVSEIITTDSSPEGSNDGSGNEVSLSTKSTTTESSEGPTTTRKQVTEEPKTTEIHDYDIASSEPFSKTEEQYDTHKESTSVNELTTDSQRNTGSLITENTSEITMDAEESIVNNGFESIGDYLHTTENYERNFVSTTQDHTSVDKEDEDTQEHYPVDGETYSASNGEHLRVSRSTSSNSMASSITAQYPEKTELQNLHIPETEDETTGAPTTNGISASSFANKAVTGDEDKSVTESLHYETTQTAPTSVQENSLESTHSTYLNSAEISSHSSDPSDDNLPTSPNTDDSYVSQVTKLNSHESGKPNGANIERNVEEAEKAFEDEPKEDIPSTASVEVLLIVEPTTGLLKDNNIAPDLIIPVEHRVNDIPFHLAETENTILSDHSADVTKEHITNPTTSTPELEISEAQNEGPSESNDKNKASEREENDDLISRFSRTSERYATDETLVDATTENLQTFSSYAMDAEAEISYPDDSTDSNEENSEHQSATYSPSSGQTSVYDSDNSQTPSDSEEEELVGKEFEGGPEKGGEWFEPTVHVLSAINVHEAKDQTGTSADITTTVKYSTSTHFKAAVTMENEEASLFVTEMTDETQKNLDNVHSSTFFENQPGKPTTTTSSVGDFANSVDEKVISTTSTKEAPSTTSASYETTHVGVIDDLEHNENIHQVFYSSEPDADQNANMLTTEEPQANDAKFIGDEANGSSSEGLNSATSREVKELGEKETEEDKLSEQTGINGITHEDATKLDQSDDRIQTTTAKTNSISQIDEVEPVAASEDENRGASINAELREQKDIKGDAKHFSQHEGDNAGSETTKESDVSLNDIMLSDGGGSIMRFTDEITDGSDLITDHVSTTESGAVDEDLGKGIENTSSHDEEFYTNPEQVTNDEVLYVKASSEENESQESTTTKVNSNRLEEADQSSELSTEGGHSFEKNTENLISLGDQTEGFQHKSDDDHSTEHFTTSYFKSTTPLPLLLFNQFVEKIKEDSPLNQNSQPREEQPITVQPEETSEVFNELSLDEKTEADLEKQSHDNSEVAVTNDHEISTTTQSSSNEHDSVSTTQSSQEKQTEIYSTSSRPVEFTSQNSYPTENSHSDHSQDKTEKVTDSTESSKVTEPNSKSEKNVSHSFFIRRSHDDYTSDGETPQNKEENTAEKSDVIYSVKSPEFSVKNPDDTDQEEHDEVTASNEGIKQDEGSTDDTHHRNFHGSDLETTFTSRSSVESTSTVTTNVDEASAIGSSADEKFHVESTEVSHNRKDEDKKDVTTSDPMNSDTIWYI